MHLGVGITSVEFLKASQLQLLSCGGNIMCKDKKAWGKWCRAEKASLRYGCSLGARARTGVN